MRRAFANLRQSSWDGTTGSRAYRQQQLLGGYHHGSGRRHHHHGHHHRSSSHHHLYGGGGLRPRASSSETNLRRLAMGDHYLGLRPGSALGLLQGRAEQWELLVRRTRGSFERSAFWGGGERI